MSGEAEMVRQILGRTRPADSTDADDTPDAINSAFADALDRRFSDTDARKARLLGVPVDNTRLDPIIEAHRIQEERRSAASNYQPLNGPRVTASVAAALSGPSSTVRTPGQ